MDCAALTETPRGAHSSRGNRAVSIHKNIYIYFLNKSNGVTDKPSSLWCGAVVHMHKEIGCFFFGFAGLFVCVAFRKTIRVTLSLSGGGTTTPGINKNLLKP
jgi:hypothetical protein